MAEITRILAAIEQGEAGAADQLLPLVYSSLRRLAAERLSHEKPGQTLQATALVHEAFLRLVGSDQHFNNERHFFVAAAEAMRRILVEIARRKKRCRHGGDYRRVELDEAAVSVHLPSDDVVALDEALKRLEQEHPDSAELVKLRYFAGLTTREAAKAMKISLRTAERQWIYARTWLHREISKDDIGV